MKRSEIETGKEYAVRSGAKISRARVGSVSRSGAVCIYDYKGVQCTSELPLRQILMPWPRWEAEQRAKRERDEAVRRQRIDHDAMVWRGLQADLARRGIHDPLAIDGERRTVTLSWDQLVRLLGAPDGR